MKLNQSLISFSLLALAALPMQARERLNFDKGWLFTLADSAGMEKNDYADLVWRHLDLPHDWAIEGDFSPTNPSGASGGALPGGIGWYRKHFSVSPKEKYDKYAIAFDGVYMNATVYVNGHNLGTRPYGYSSFEYDLTPYLNKKGDNVVAVRVNNGDQPNSRWYSGCGIYRHVWLVMSKAAHISQWGQYVSTTPDGTVRIRIDWTDAAGINTADAPANAADGKVVKSSLKPTFRNTIYDAEGRVVATQTSASNEQTLQVKNPKLWDVISPYIYKVKSELLVKGKVVDTEVTTTGFRDVKFDAQKGFFLNGKNMKLNGVCEHHDFGCLGAALNEDALRRKLLILRDMGVNAIRCSHNPPAPELLNMCDTMGLLVMDESFDMWRRKKSQNDYARFFDEWHQRDLSDLVKRDRNHPSVIMWSIGNEVLEQWSDAAADTLSLEQANLILNAGHDASTLAKDGELSVNSLLTQHLAEIVKEYDPWGTRPITSGCNEPDPNNHLFKSGALDVIGFNYHHQWVKDVPKNFPGKPFIFSESVSALQTRGFYMMPSDSIYTAPVAWWLPYSDPSFKCSAYDNFHASWSSTHEETWDVVKHNDFVGGQFIWTGFDYIGEPTPYAYPARSSYFGIIDLAGFPKDSYYMYQSEWTQKKVLHLFPHWNWILGQTIDMWCYFNHADEVELFVNGKSQGIRKKKEYVPASQEAVNVGEAYDMSTEYHVCWRVSFEPGEVKVIARKDGKQVGEQTIKTAGAPDHIVLKKTYQGNLAYGVGTPTTFVEVDVVDKDGNLCPNAENQVFFSLENEHGFGGQTPNERGNGEKALKCKVGETMPEILGVDNGCQTSLERFKADNRKAFFGKCLVVLKGKGTLTAKAVDLKEAKLEF